MAKTSNKTKNKKQTYHFSKVSITVFLILALLLTIFGFIFKKPIENLVNFNNIATQIDYNGLVMHTIDVGQAEAIMINLPDGKNMLVDSGNKGTEKIEKFKSYLINNYFNSVENQEIDYFVITHSDDDHIGGAVMIFDTFKVNKVFRPNIYSQNVNPDKEFVDDKVNNSVNNEFWGTAINKKSWDNVVEKMYAEEDCTVVFSEAGIVIQESSYKITFCAPTEKHYKNVNSYSPIIVIEYMEKRIMLTGDATTDTEEKAINNLMQCDILNVAHHGSKTSTSEEFLEKVNPTYAIISANANDSNNYGLPKQEILNRLQEYMPEKNIFRTDKNGNIVAQISNSGEIEFILDVQNNSYYIKVEYLIAGGVAILFALCFSIKKRTKK